ncbi:MAG: type IVB secretion system protein IcmH/DotU, partial [Pseudomonadota bacterium]|nr:type IVB secretion system protein IcmH/DotU [Pseudomonadota bacterium]
MSRDDPFAEPADTDRTVILPNPAGRRAPAPGGAAPAQQPGATPTAPAQPGAPAFDPPPAGAGWTGAPAQAQPFAPAPAASPAPHAYAAPPQAAGAEAPSLDAAASGLNPLNAAASPLFALVGRLRNRAQHADPAALRDSVIAEIRGFETRALRAGYPAETVRLARYALCATVDDVVLNTPWGGRSLWARASIVGTFHKETTGGDRVFDLLKRLQEDPGRNRDLLEFLYVCLSLGFEGRLRVEPRGPEKLLAIRAGLAAALRAQRGRADPDLSPHWRGVDRAHRPLSAWTPVWIAAGAALALACAVFFGFS